MKYINGLEELNREFRRLMDNYDNYYWMVAWAGDHFYHIHTLSENKHKIKQLVVGLHFYQTSPTFIENFNQAPGVRFVKKTSGIFHPKVFLFLNDETDWEVLIGSANFTRSAFNRNNEACVLIKAEEAEKPFLQEIRRSIDEVWQVATKFNPAELQDYITLAGQSRRPPEFDRPGAGLNPGPQQGAPIVRMNWREYMDRIFQGGDGTVIDRLTLLDIVSDYFRVYHHLANMPSLERKRVGGYISAGQEVDFRLFGNMQNATTFTSLMNKNPTYISNALDAIPAEGPVAESAYQTFVEGFENATDGGNKYRSATRLLAMKRPDVFFAISEGNNQLLAADFGIANVGGMNFTRYWNEVANVIWNAEWFLFPEPINETERRIVPYRAAFMDVMYYNPDR